MSETWAGITRASSDRQLSAASRPRRPRGGNDHGDPLKKIPWDQLWWGLNGQKCWDLP